MVKEIFFIGLIFIGSMGFSANLPEIKPFQKQEVILILAPHPDDETVGCGGIIQKALAEGCAVYVVFFTNGDHNEVAFKLYEKKLVLNPKDYIKMGELRRKEAIAAAEVLGVPRENLIFLGYPDYGTLKIWEQHWRNAPPYRNFLTRATNVPYPENYSYRAEYKGESIINDLKSIFSKLQPSRIFVSHPADTNVDHRALYNFTIVALMDMEGKIPTPLVYPYLVHFGRWPYPYHYHPDLMLTPPDRLANSEILWENYNLTDGQGQKKLDALGCYKSQEVDRGYWLVSFVKRNEIFGGYRIINLTGIQPVEGEAFFYGLAEGDLPPEILSQKSKIDRFSFRKENNKLFLQVKFNKVLEKDVGFSIYAFGYSRKIPFPDMPKISISFLPPDRIVLRDGRNVIFNNGLVVNKTQEEVFVEIPLWILKDPDFIFLAMESWLGEIPLDLTAWRLIEIK